MQKLLPNLSATADKNPKAMAIRKKSLMGLVGMVWVLAQFFVVLSFYFPIDINSLREKYIVS